MALPELDPAPFLSSRRARMMRGWIPWTPTTIPIAATPAPAAAAPRSAGTKKTPPPKRGPMPKGKGRPSTLARLSKSPVFLIAVGFFGSQTGDWTIGLAKHLWYWFQSHVTIKFH